MMKPEFEPINMKIIYFSAKDILITSAEDAENWTPQENETDKIF